MIIEYLKMDFNVDDKNVSSVTYALIFCHQYSILHIWLVDNKTSDNNIINIKMFGYMNRGDFPSTIPSSTIYFEIWITLLAYMSTLICLNLRSVKECKNDCFNVWWLRRNLGQVWCKVQNSRTWNSELFPAPKNDQWHLDDLLVTRESNC